MSALSGTALSPPGPRAGVTFIKGRMRTSFLIDGFNFYHSIRGLPRKLRWFNYHAYCCHFMQGNDSLHSITYFTSLAFWLPPQVQRHQIFIEACKAQGIEIVLGKFKEKNGNCSLCRQPITRHEEKATDVNIALYAYRLAAHSIAEKIVLVTGDTDLIPAIKMIKQDYPAVRVEVVFPFNRKTKELAQEADFSRKTTQNILNSFVLPMAITDATGKIITCPPAWA